MRVVNARGLACPQPVLLTRKAMEESNDIVTIVGNPDQAGNVARMACGAGWTAQVDGKEDGIHVRVTRPQEAVGTVSNMYTIAETLLRAGRAVSL